MQHLFKEKDKWYLFETDGMHLFKVSGEMNDVLDGYTPEQLDVFEKEANKADTQVFETMEEENKGLCERLILNITDACNLACTYCYADEGSYGIDTRQVYMALETLKEGITKVLEMYPAGIGMIQFFGGEPLINRKVLQESVLWMETFFKQRQLEMPILTMVTNGTLVTDEDISFFNRYFASITISIDGEKEINDQQRIYRDSEESVYDRVKEVVLRMKEKDRQFYLALEGTIDDCHIENFKKQGTNSTYHDLNAFPVDRIHISPVIDSKKEDDPAKCKDYSDFFGDWVDNEFRKNKHNIRLKNIVHIMEAAKENIVYGNGCGASKTDLAISVDGDLYPCFMFIGADAYKIGNVKEPIEDLKNRHDQIRHEISLAENNTRCNACWLKPLCAKTHGHCIGARYLTSSDINQPVERFCKISERVVETSLANAENEWSVLA